MPKLNGIVFIALVMSFFSCAPSLKMTDEELSTVSSEEGLVIGSIQIKLVDDTKGKKPRWKSSLEDTEWNFKVYSEKNNLDKYMFKIGDFQLSAIAGKEESPFLAKLSAGKYVFGDVFQKGFKARHGFVGKSFMVEAGQSTYVGRLVIKMPKYASNWGGVGFTVGYTIEDAKEDTLSVLKDTHNNLDGYIKTQLMKLDNTPYGIESFNKDQSIKKTIIRLYKRLGKGFFILYDHWGDDKTAIGICSPQNYKRLVYISTYDTPINHFNVRLELPPVENSNLPYTDAGKFYAISFEELVEIIKKHLKG